MSIRQWDGVFLQIHTDLCVWDYKRSRKCAARAYKSEWDNERGEVIKFFSFSLQNLRVKYYKEGDWIIEMQLDKG